MTEIPYQTLIWLTYRLGAIFAFGLPIVITSWASLKKEKSIVRLLSIYWKIASIMPISMLLLIGNKQIGYLTTFISPLLLILAVWFWVDLNEELAEFPPWRALPFTVRIWRWGISFFGCFYLMLSISTISCIQSIDGKYCESWLKTPQNLHLITKNIFNFFLGANWTEQLAAFVGLLALIIYFVGIIQWALIRLPKQGRIAGDF